MKEQQKFYNAAEVNYAEIIPVYQEAFAGAPWYEVTKCADTKDVQRCVGGFSSLPLGTLCEPCGNKTMEPAYSVAVLENKFKTIAASRPTAWYLEKNALGITLAALAWEGTPEMIAQERYKDVPIMQQWMKTTFGEEPIIWLDEVFADRKKSPSGNLKNFKLMCSGLADTLQLDTIAYRTITDQMIYAPLKNFGEKSTIYKRNNSVPDRRDFVVISLGGKK